MNYFIKHSKKAGTIGLLFLMAVAYSCSDLSSYNDNSNATSSAPTSYLLTEAQHDLADNYWGEFPLGYFGNLYAQYWSQNQYSEESRYAFRPGVVNNIWNSYYLTLNSLQQIIRQNRNDPNGQAQYGKPANQIAVAKVLKAWAYENLTEIYGDIPFEEALGGAKNPSPTYTSQEKVYTGIVKMLTEASDSIDTSSPAFSSGDIIYGGNAEKWKNLANSLKLRIAMRLAEAKPGKAKTWASEAVQAGVIESNDGNALFGYNSAPPNNNPINEAYKGRDDFAVSGTLLDYMNSKDDPRRGAYAAKSYTSKAGERDDDVPAGADDYIGFPYGLAQGQAVPLKNTHAWSRPSLRVRQATAPAIFMTASEVLFNEAEAAQRGFITSANASSKYDAAIQKSMDYWDVSSSDASAFISAHPYNAGNYVEQIGRQKWVALYMQGIQGWSTWRRMNFGLLHAPVSGKLSVTFDADVALRYPYPTDEKNLNDKNVQAAISNQGFAQDDQGQELWFDAQSN